jgi:hypothetical protein
MGCLGSNCSFPLEELLPQLRQHRRRLFLSHFEPRHCGKILGLLFYCVEFAHQVYRFPHYLGSCFFRFDYLSPHVRPTSGTRDLVARNDAVVAAVSVCKWGRAVANSVPKSPHLSKATELTTSVRMGYTPTLLANLTLFMSI